MKTRRIPINLDSDYSDAIYEAARVIREGGLVVFPTETVYGIAADYNNPKAMERLRSVKQRTEGKQFSVLIAQRGIIANYTSYTDPKLYKLIDRYWPGPLTLVVPSREKGEESIGVRMPDHVVALKMVEAAHCTIAAPSANAEGNPPPSTCDEALRDCDGLVELALDAGNVEIGTSSTVLDCTQDEPTVLREGVISQADVNATINKKEILFVCTGNSCRSVMAEYLLRNEFAGRDDVGISSAGTSVFFQSSASAETISVLRELDIDATRHLSRPLSTIQLKKADLIIVMTRSHRAAVLERVPSVEKRVYLLKEFANTKGHEMALDVPDPIGQSHAAYQQCLEVIKEGVLKIKELI